MKRAIVMDKSDTVATALEDLSAGDVIELALSAQEVLSKILSRERIPFGHKLAITAMRKGDNVIKYGEIIGRASSNIQLGDCVHVHNLESNRMKLPEIWYRK